MDANVKEKAAKIRLLLMDVDGVWTDGNLFYVPGPGGEMVEAKQSNAQDGMGLRWAHASGLESGLISGRDSPGVTHRAEMLHLRRMHRVHHVEHLVLVASHGLAIHPVPERAAGEIAARLLAGVWRHL